MFETPIVDADSSNQEAPKQEQPLSEEERIKQIKDKIAEINMSLQNHKNSSSAFYVNGILRLTDKLEKDLELKAELEEELRNTARRNLIKNNLSEELVVSDEKSAEEDEAKLKDVMKKISDIK